MQHKVVMTALRTQVIAIESRLSTSRRQAEGKGKAGATNINGDGHMRLKQTRGSHSQGLFRQQLAACWSTHKYIIRALLYIFIPYLFSVRAWTSIQLSLHLSHSILTIKMHQFVSDSDCFRTLWYFQGLVLAMVHKLSLSLNVK